MTIKKELDEIRECQRQGDLLRIEEIAKELQKKPPNNAMELDELGFLCVQAGLLNEAQNVFEKAIQLKPKAEVLHNHLGNVYRKNNRHEQAEASFKKAIELKGNYAQAHNNYGLLLYKKNEFEKAEQQFIEALKSKADYFDAMYNLALSLKAQNKDDEAIASLIAILETKPEHRQGNFLLGKLLLKKKLYREANEYFMNVVNLMSGNNDVLVSIIKVLLDHNRYTEAKSYCEKIIAKEPEGIDGNYMLGVINTKLGERQKAIENYRIVLQKNAHHFPSLNNIAVLYLDTGKIETAKIYFQQALQLQPDNEAIGYTLSALSEEQVFDKAPKEYIKKLFDSYANHFETHLCEGLDYQVPKLLKEAVETCVQGEISNWRVLDLGCGTGLCGEAFRSWAKHLVGVDLSAKMIEKAKQKECYDELLIKENLEYLKEQTAAFDLIVAADVFVYQGDLQQTFTACHKALSQGGLLAFSTEIYLGENYIMHPTGRFVHSKGYIEKVAKEEGFRVLAAKIAQTRLQNDENVDGYIFVLAS